MIDLYQQRVTVEKRKGLIQAIFINSLLTAYFAFAVKHLILPDLAISGWIYFLIGLGVGLPWSFSTESAGRICSDISNPVLKSVRGKRDGAWIKTFSGIYTSLILVITVALGWVLTDISFYALFSLEGMSGAERIFSAMLNPQTGIIEPVMEAMVVTIFIAFMSTALSLPVAFFASFFCALNLMRGSASTMAIYTALRFFFNFIRSVEPIIWAIIFSVWVGIGPFAGMIALMLPSVASLAKLFSEQIESIDSGPVEAIEATGANKFQVVWYAVVPQIILPYISFSIYRWDINIRMATIIGLVGGGGIGTLLMQYQGLARWNEVGMIILVIAAVVWAMDYMSAKIRDAIK